MLIVSKSKVHQVHIPRGGLGVGKSDAGIGNDTRGEAWSHCGTCWGGADERYMLLRGDGVGHGLEFPILELVAKGVRIKKRMFYGQ